MFSVDWVARCAARLMIARMAALANPETAEVMMIFRRTPADSRFTRSRKVVFPRDFAGKNEKDIMLGWPY